MWEGTKTFSIMKNLKSLFVFATLLLLASCSKEPILQTEELSVNPMHAVEKINQQSKNKQHISINSADGTSVPVTTISSTVAGEDLVVDFSSSHNFIDADLEATQTLEFVDGGGRVTRLTFDVNYYTGGNGDLQANFAIGGNDLSGLTIVVAQEIIIDDEMVI